jgi:microcystin-dependent protein
VSQPFVGEIRMFAGNFAPADWMFCDGTTLPIAGYEVLFQLIGTTYGGDGQSTFQLPDLRGRVPVHQGNGYPLSQAAGAEEVAITTSTYPSHNHAFLGSTSQGGQRTPVGNALATVVAGSAYVQQPPTAPLAPATIQNYPGSGQPHNNFQPYLCISFIISLFGVFPTQG